ncbi:Rv3235 family protein [Micrococcoides hystricis]|uniref:Rv3235 family protein n=1 Tax=Micrococcoides hystricis TaxID=1572761 RepID=A0ABV6P878_9MICC
MSLTPVKHHAGLDERLLANVNPMTDFCLSQPSQKVSPSVRLTAVPTTEQMHAEVDKLGRTFTLALFQILAGERPVAQLCSWFDLDGYEEFMHRYGIITRHRHRQERQGKESLAYRRASVISVHQCHIHARCIELSVVMRDATRVRAVAMQLKLNSRRRWQITELEIG